MIHNLANCLKYESWLQIVLSKYMGTLCLQGAVYYKKVCYLRWNLSECNNPYVIKEIIYEWPEASNMNNTNIDISYTIFDNTCFGP